MDDNTPLIGIRIVIRLIAIELKAEARISIVGFASNIEA